MSAERAGQLHADHAVGSVGTESRRRATIASIAAMVATNLLGQDADLHVGRKLGQPPPEPVVWPVGASTWVKSFPRPSTAAATRSSIHSTSARRSLEPDAQPPHVVMASTGPNSGLCPQSPTGTSRPLELDRRRPHVRADQAGQSFSAKSRLGRSQASKAAASGRGRTMRVA